MAKITKASLAELAKKMQPLTREEQASIVGGTQSTYTAFGKATNDQGEHALEGLNQSVFSTQVGHAGLSHNDMIGNAKPHILKKTEPKKPSTPFTPSPNPDDNYNGTPIDASPGEKPKTPIGPSGAYGDPKNPSGAYGDTNDPSGAYGDPNDPSGAYGDSNDPSGYVGGNNSNGNDPEHEKRPPTIKFNDENDRKDISDKTIGVLNSVFSDLNVSGLTITSTARTPQEQAAAMLANIKRSSVEAQKRIYANAGDQVLSAYDSTLSDSENLRRMTEEIYRQGPSKVSHHCADPKKSNVFDIAISSLGGKDVNEIKRALESQGAKVLIENNCIHVEISQ